MEENKTILAWYYVNGEKKQVSVKDLTDWLQEEPFPKEKIAEFIYYRLYSRYLKPFTLKKVDPYIRREYKNGFAMMACYSLYIEAFQSFRRGLTASNKIGKSLFENFFKEEKAFFPELHDKGKKFYENIRCGILHQGETMHGWKISRSGKKLFDNDTQTVDAVLFGKQLEKVLSNYKMELENSKVDSSIWKFCKTKLQSIMDNCK